MKIIPLAEIKSKKYNLCKSAEIVTIPIERLVIL